MKSMGLGLLALAAAGSAAFGQTTVYTTEAAFNAVLAPGAYDEGFAGSGSGPFVSLSFSGGSGPFAYTIDTPPGSLSGLYNAPGVISTDNADDRIRVTFTGAAVTALGVYSYGTDISFGVIPATMTLTLNNGHIETFDSVGPTFRGFTTNVGIAEILIDANGGAAFAWPTLDRMIAGTKTGGGCSGCCCVDFNNDEEFDFTDIEGFLAAYAAQNAGSCKPGADFNGDEEFDFSDIEQFLAQYGPCAG